MTNLSTTLGPHKIAIVFEDMRHEGFKGQACHAERKIRLDDELCPSDVQETFVHESVHMVSERFDLGLDERAVSALGVGLAQMLAPWLRPIRKAGR